MRRDRVVGGLAVLGAVTVVYARVWRPWQLHWGATPDEMARSMPGDEIVPRPRFDATRALTVDAAPEHVWPWLAQMGAFTRAGWYSYDAFDNRGVPSAEVVVPDLQDLRVGDVMPLGEDGQGFTVEAVEPPRSLVLAARQRTGTISTTYLLEPIGRERTRLLQRMRYRLRPHTPAEWFVVVGMDVGELLMARKSLLGIKRRAERLARARPGAYEPVEREPATPLTYDLSVVVRRPPADVFAVLADVQDWTDAPRSGVSMVKEPPGETGVGTRWRETVRLGPGLRLVVRSVVTAAEPDRLLVEDFSSPYFTGTLRYSLDRVPEGTLLRQVQRLHLRRGLHPLTGAVDRGFRRRVVRRLADLRDLVEALPPTDPRPPGQGTPVRSLMVPGPVATPHTPP